MAIFPVTCATDSGNTATTWAWTLDSTSSPLKCEAEQPQGEGFEFGDCRGLQTSLYFHQPSLVLLKDLDLT